MKENELSIKRPGLRVGDSQRVEQDFSVEDFDLYGRHHDVSKAMALATLTRLPEGVHLDLEVRCTIRTTCDRTLEPTTIEVALSESELIGGPRHTEMCVEEWVMDLGGYARQALPSEIPLQVFASGSEPVHQGHDEGKMDPRWRALDDLFASGL